jgi:hypothetical protein
MRGFGNLMFPSWFILLGGSFVFLDVGPPILFLAFPPFLGCFGLFMIWQGFVNTLVYQLKHQLYTISQSLCSYHLPMPKIETKSFGNNQWEGSTSTYEVRTFFLLGGRGVWIFFFWVTLFPMCFHHVPKRNPQVLKLFPKTFPIAPQIYLTRFAQSSTLMYINSKGRLEEEGICWTLANWNYL